MVEALLAAGVTKDDPRHQEGPRLHQSLPENLKSEYNDQPFAEKVSDDDKGRVRLQPRGPGQPEEPEAHRGGRACEPKAAMTYAGLKSFLYAAGVGKDDPRVKARDRVDSQALHADRKTRGRRTKGSSITT